MTDAFGLDVVVAAIIDKWLGRLQTVRHYQPSLLAIVTDEVIIGLECLHQHHWILYEVTPFIRRLLERLALGNLMRVDLTAKIIVDVIVHNIDSVQEIPGNWAIDDTGVFCWHYAVAA